MKHLAMMLLLVLPLACGTFQDKTKSTPKESGNLNTSKVCLQLEANSLGLRKVECAHRDILVNAFNGASYLFGAITKVCAAFTEPLITKGTVPVVGLTGLALGAISFGLEQIDCKDSDRDLKIREIICQETGGTWLAPIETCDRKL